MSDPSREIAPEWSNEAHDFQDMADDDSVVDLDEARRLMRVGRRRVRSEANGRLVFHL